MAATQTQRLSQNFVERFPFTVFFSRCQTIFGSPPLPTPVAALATGETGGSIRFQHFSIQHFCSLLLFVMTYILTPGSERVGVHRVNHPICGQANRAPTELVIVRGGSTDRTDEIVRSHASKCDWIEFVRMPERTTSLAPAPCWRGVLLGHASPRQAANL